MRRKSEYIPYLPPHDIIMRLSKLKEHANCPHELHSSSELFINHLLWSLLSKSTHHNRHFQYCKLLVNATNHYPMCIECFTTLLSLVTFADIMRSYVFTNITCIQPLSKQHQMYISKLKQNLFIYAIDYPKSHRLMIKTCIMNQKIYEIGLRTFNGKEEFTCVDVFGTVCNVMIDLIQYLAQTPESLRSGLFFGQTIPLLKMFYLSINYWNQYHILYFFRYYFLQLENVWNIVNQLSGSVLIITFINMLQWIMNKFVHKLLKLPKKMLKNIPMHLNYNQLQMYQSFSTNGSKEWSEDSRTCSWIGCRKRQIETVKLCSKCRIVYYCSKSCQKKSWNKHHRIVCKQLHEYYVNSLLRD
eukprot:197197_1